MQRVWVMKKLSREEAEALFLDFDVINTVVHQDSNELRVIMTLSSNEACHVTYNYSSKEKSYHLQEPGELFPYPAS
jgi:hypothetical protein